MDPKKVEAFVGKVLGDTAGSLVTVLAMIGDRLSLFKNLAENGPATSEELGVSGPSTRVSQPRRAKITPNASRPIECRSFGPHARTRGWGRNGGGAIADRRASHTRTASVARCSCATSQSPEAHRLPSSRIAGNAVKPSRKRCTRPPSWSTAINSGGWRSA